MTTRRYNRTVARREIAEAFDTDPDYVEITGDAVYVEGDLVGTYADEEEFTEFMQDNVWDEEDEVEA